MANPNNITLRSEKGSFLTFEEMDLNLTELQNQLIEYNSFISTQFNPLDADHDDLRLEWTNYQTTVNNRLDINEQDIVDINNDQTVQDGRISQNESDILALQLGGGLTYQGNWAAVNAPYSVGDVVTYTDGLDYISVSNNNTQEPVSGTKTNYWIVLNSVPGVTVKYTLMSASFVALANNRYSLDAATPFNITLPATPSTGSTIEFFLISGDATVNNITVERNGQTIEGLAEDMVVDSNSPRGFRLYYTGTTWRVAQ